MMLTPLQEEIMENSQMIVREKDSALKKCYNKYEREKCINAYNNLHKMKEDQIMQKYGLPALQWNNK